MEPVASLAIQNRASSSASMPISDAACARRPLIVSSGISWKLNCWQRLLIVAGTFCVSVVAKMKTTYSGGSSIVLRRALNALWLSMWTSSMM